MSDWLDFSGKVVLVTGSSRGIGAGMIRAFDQHGAKCVINFFEDPAGQNEADANELARTIRNPLILECDVGDDTQVESMMDRVRRELGGLDVLINNAGIMRDRTIRKMSADEWESVLRVNLTGTFNCIRHAQPILRAGSRILNISSLSGQVGFFGQANYAASKAGIMALTRVTARELARQQITVNAIAPGVVETEMSRDIPDDVTRKFLEQIPLARLGRIEDIVNAALFLCSARAAYITGQVIHVNGGFFMG